MTRLHIPIPLRWGDLDAYGHINNVETLRLIEEARVRAFWRSEGADAHADPNPQPTAVLDLTADSTTWSLVSRSEVEYLIPMPYTRAPIDVEVWIGRLGGASIEICFELFSPAGVEPRVLYARASTAIVTVDAASGRPTRIPALLRELWAPYLEDPISFSRR
ncbi:MAG: thioesterase family protein [Pseudolysinimonas sp.]